ncbi:MAG: peptidyl-prolyl cis-trans isomerase [Bryobacteraceae bacterium]|jgi:peptidyl-prolyl cis-trans isomerase D
MFDLFRSRQKAVRYILGGMLMLVALSMVITLIPGYGSTTGSSTDTTTLANVDGQKLSADQVQRSVQDLVRAGRLPADMVDVYVPQFIDQMIRETAAVREFQSMGLTVSDDEVLTGLMSAYPQFFQNGALVAKDQLEAVLAQQGQSLQDAIEDMRKSLLLRKVQNMMLATAIVSPKELDNELIKKDEKVKIDYIAFPPAKFHDEVKPTPEDIRAYFDAHRGNYTIPEKRAFQVLVVDQAKVEDSLVISDAQLRAAYSANMDNFRMPERVKVRHILVKTTDKSDADKKQALAKANDILKQVKSGGNFPDLVKKYSDDTGTKDQGGEMWIVRGQTVPEFEKEAFSLKPSEISGIVSTEYGYHIIQVLEKESPHVKPFDEVKAGLAADLKKDGVTEKVQSLADQVHAALEKSPGSAADIAKQLNVELVTVPAGKAGDPIPTLGTSPEIDGALAGMKKNDVSPVLALPANRLVVVVLNDRTPARPAEFDEVAAQVRDNVINDKATAIANDRAKAAADRLKAGEDIDKVAKSMKLDLSQPPEFTRADSVEGLGAASYVSEAFTKPVGTVLGPIMIQTRNVVCKVVAKQAPDPAVMAQEREALLSQLKQKKAIAEYDLFMDSILSKLVSQGKVKKYPDAIKRTVASLRP